MTGRNGRGFKGRSGGVGGRCSTLTLRRGSEPAQALGEAALVKDVDARKVGCCVSIFRAGGGVERLLPALLVCLSLVARQSVVC